MRFDFIQRCALVGVMAAALLALGHARAADIDLYAAGGTADSAPNILFFLDNSSNWSAASQAWSKTDVQAKCTTVYGSGTAAEKICLTYADAIFGSNSSLVQGQVELRALKLVLNELACTGDGSGLKLNVGLMLFNSAGTADSNSGVSGYIRRRIAPMDQTNCKTFTSDLDTIDSKITTPDFKGPSSAEYGAPLYEAFKYFGGFTNPAGVQINGSSTAGTPTDATHFGPQRYGLKTSLEDPAAFSDASRTTYSSPITSTNSCGKNFIVLIGNTWPNQEFGTNTAAPNYPTNLLMQRLSYDPGPQIYPVPLPNSAKADVRFADEWAKFLYSTDVSDAPGQQNLLMYTVDVYNKSPDAKQGALLKSMADTNGPGGYFQTGGDVKALVDAIKNILTRVTAVNSVFASASLPVSVNAQGTFLNQIFMGVFRPDAKGQQRWYGNLKQYQLALSGNTLSLVDAFGKDAVDSNSTGFIQNCATSFWTGDSGTYWETITAQPSACLTSTYSRFSDAPDGPMVERGAAAQRLRSSDPAKRNIRTCSKTDCSAGLMDFNTTNVTKIGTLDGTQTATLVDWARGVNSGDGFTDASGTTYSQYGMDPTATRPTVHGEVVHSRPLAVNYGVAGANDVVVFYGAGDGMLRAVDGNQKGATAGSELWAFIAPEHWSALDRLHTNSPLIAYPNTPSLSPTPLAKTYFFDGAIGGYQERTSSSVGKLWIYPTMRRGGTGVYAFDVTNRPGATAQPRLMWKYSATDQAGMGQSWSTPLALRVQGRSDPLLVFGAGYHDCEDDEDPFTACSSVTQGRGIVVMNAKDGKAASGDYRFIDPGPDAGRFVADMALVDVNGDGYVDAIYAVDTRGNIWRINTSNPATGFTGYASVNDWPVVKVAATGQWGASITEQRKLMYAPSTVVLGKQVLVLVGSGNREKPLADSTASQVINRFYGIRDDVTVVDSVSAVIGYGSAPPQLLDVTNKTGITPQDAAKYRGWFLNLSSTAAPYEQVVTTPLTIAGVTYFSTFQAKNLDASSSSCMRSTARAYRVDFQTGTALPDAPLTEVFLSPGFPPSPVGGVVQIGSQPVPFLIGGSGPTVLSPTRVVPTVKPSRKPIYRFQRIDG